MNIVGGKDSNYDEAAAASVVYISTENDQGHNEICTGTFISTELILTAAHCIAKEKEGMSLSFRPRDFIKTKRIIDIKITETYKLDFSTLLVERNDLGVIHFEGGLPEGAKIAILPKSNKNKVLPSRRLLAIGYGQNTGVKSDDEMANTGEGVLRTKTLVSELIKTDKDNFKIDQLANKGGICFGDSGGPALILDPVTKKNMIIGVASAVLTKRTGPDIDPNDDCKNQSMYLNMYYYAEYFNSFLKKAIESKAMEKKLALENKNLSN